jgi:arabinogalactan oligomer/maltooligosaccharide transport system substrate-binding protein
VDNKGRHSLDPDFDPEMVATHGLYLRGDGYTFLPFLWAMGGRTLDPKSHKVFIADEPSVSAAKYVRDLRLRHRVLPEQVDFANDYRDEIEAFRQGRVSMIVNGPWATDEIMAEGVFADHTNLGIAPVPRGASGQGGSPVGGHGYVIPTSAKHAEAAKLLGRFLSGPRGQLVLATKNNILPTRKALYDDPALKENPRVGAFRLALEQGHQRAVFPGMARMFDALTPAVQRIMVAEAEPDALLSTVAKEWQTILEP